MEINILTSSFDTNLFVLYGVLVKWLFLSVVKRKVLFLIYFMFLSIDLSFTASLRMINPQQSTLLDEIRGTIVYKH